MIKLEANKVSLTVRGSETITSGAQNIFQCQFSFSADWNGLDKTAVFKSSRSEPVCVPLLQDGLCMIPWEVLTEPSLSLEAGVYGTRNNELVMPTVMANLGKVRRGASLGDATQPPPTDVYAQILASANEAQAVAQALRADAEAGRFDGSDGEPPEIGANGNWFIGGIDTGKPSRGEAGSGTGTGVSGATFVPSVDSAGNLSWTNDKGLANPATVNIRGPKGKDGADGAPGAKGDKGDPGADGADGYTPVKGTDYWTDTDREQMIADVLATLPNGSEVEY